jgi:cell division protein FtsL
MEQNRSKIFIIGISILVIVFIGVWIFVVSTLLSTSKEKQTLGTDIQQEIVYQTGSKEH